jgi:CBS domain containing-hemolysin-like protein
MTLLLIFLFLTLATSFICSLSEAVILSVPDAYVSILEKQGRKSGQLLHSLHDQIDKPLAAVLTFNTIANTVGSMLIGRQVLKIYGETSLAVASVGLTLLILICTEILPKTIGAVYCKRLAPFIAHIITWMVYVSLPIVFISRQIRRFFNEPDATTTREEVIATAEMSADEGVLHAKESKIIKNLLMLDKVKVSEVMTPRSVMNAFNVEETVDTIMATHKPVRFSRIPVYEGHLDNVVGLLHRYKLMEAVSHDLYNTPLREIMTSIHKVTEDTPISAALDQFIKRREHLFLVVNANGATMGIVTLEDAIETLLGVEIVDEYDTVTDMRQYAMEQWRLRKQALLKKEKP